MSSSTRSIEEILNMKKLITAEEYLAVFKNRDIFKVFLNAQRRKWAAMRSEIEPWERNSALYHAMAGIVEIITTLDSMEVEIQKYSEAKRADEAKKATAENGGESKVSDINNETHR